MDGTSTNIQSKSDFKIDKACYYTIQAPSTAPDGGLLYLSFTSLSNVQAYITIGDELVPGDDVVQCFVNTGNTLVARTPNKFLISFQSTVSDNSKFYFDAYYAPFSDVGNVQFDNGSICSDFGENLGGIITPSHDDSSSSDSTSTYIDC